MLERDIQRACLQLLKLKGIFAWRNNTVGIYNPKTENYYFHGLRGVSDILGILPQKCPCALQGVFLAIEVKQPKKHPTNEQAAFLKRVNDLGGIGLCVHSVEELEEELDRYL
jgi:hypothetical protein